MCLFIEHAAYLQALSLCHHGEDQLAQHLLARLGCSHRLAPAVLQSCFDMSPTAEGGLLDACLPGVFHNALPGESTCLYSHCLALCDTARMNYNASSKESSSCVPMHSTGYTHVRSLGILSIASCRPSISTVAKGSKSVCSVLERAQLL